MRFRSAIIPTLLILGAGMACDEPSSTNSSIDSLETEAPQKSELENIRWRCQSFLTEHNPEVTVQGFTFNQLTPNVYLVNVEVTDSKNKNKYLKQLSCEKVKDVKEDDDGDLITQNEELYVIDYADPFKMAQIAERHGFANEVRDISNHNRGLMAYNTGYHDHWMDDYLIWSTLYNRPYPMYYGYGSGFAPRPVGFRPYAPAAPISSGFVRGSAFGWVAGRTAGRSSAFTSGIARNPPNVTHLRGSGGTAFSPSGGKASVSSAGRGGFGGTSAGHGGASGG